ncbi:MAG: isoleucine--tRNA ligase [Candidatus Woykebacteria bacterium RIFCSPHIGHO2_12_FULL_45_10]|uniref:Isoleucine--tRNA ligase n=1 Tax=Candidatus Woykebacteria bacterium RIFCSPHIGHO2_12_FULL_45_10 TaxID=1802603 RepID=A0A1G1WQR3_9BACT|nr:MAG: isoleucine--tRNA ligase [Candidatus Woykebacteria bacterium RIFCSPHIGHO2_12_FULL_45_10]
MFGQVESQVDFPLLERKILQYWQKNKIVEKYLAKNRSSKEKFRFIDGPITANNPMGVHHAWGRTYKDLWQRFYNMLGYKQRFQNGFDEQGLWVEVEVERELGLHTKKDIENLVSGSVFESVAKFVNLCKERVKKYSAVQIEQSERLGYFMDWGNSYHTSSDQNNYAIWHYLKTVHDKGWLYKGRDSVPWCPRCGTAISQHEILTEEYKEVVHKAVFFKLPLKNRENEYLLVWTTTPWTIPGNVMVAVNQELKYQASEVDGDLLWYAKDRYEDLKKYILSAAHPNQPVKIRRAEFNKNGKDLVGLEYEGPFDDLPKVKEAKGEAKGNFHKVIAAADLVTAEEGTGFVHIAPGAGEEDFKLHKEKGFSVIELIGEDATYIDGLEEFSGQNAKKHPELIIDYLKEHEGGKFFFNDENYKHRYPICWRCKTELVWRVVDEWYISMDKPSISNVKAQSSNKKTYRELMKEVIKEINWIPKWGYERELDWLNNLHDWLISKKRYWGLALPIWECENCGSFDVIGSRDELKEKAVEGWKDFVGNSPHRPWVDLVKIKCTRCGEVSSRVPDVGNPWLDAGIVPYSTLKYFEDKSYWQEWFPADFITESFLGQFKNWFYSLIAMSTALEDAAPFKTLLGHGQVRDEKGEEMHKSKGNAIWFDDAAEKMGVDVMRWLYLRTNPEHNVNFGYKSADEIRRFFHIRLWNVFAFFMNYASLDKWEPSEEGFDPTNILDKWVFSRLAGSVGNFEKYLKEYRPHEAIGLAEIFIVNDLSNWYVRRIRDRVGPAAPEGKDKNDAYETLFYVLVTLTKTLAPMLPFVAEEMFKQLTGQESVHLTPWPKLSYKADNALEEDMTAAMEIASKIHALRKVENIKVRQPLNQASYGGSKLANDIEGLIADEINVKSLVNDSKLKEGEVRLDTAVTLELALEGEARDLVRSIQEARKEAKCELNEVVIVQLPAWPRQFEDYIKKQTLAKDLVRGDGIAIQKTSN